jgi:hypothetical protein
MKKTIEGVLLLMACSAMLIPSARATQDYCLTVRNTPDGYLALRAGPGGKFKMKARLKPGELLVADTGMCRDDLCDETRQWTFINSVPRLDGRNAKRFTQGWVAAKFTKGSPLGRCSLE